MKRLTQEVLHRVVERTELVFQERAAFTEDHDAVVAVRNDAISRLNGMMSLLIDAPGELRGGIDAIEEAKKRILNVCYLRLVELDDAAMHKAAG